MTSKRIREVRIYHVLDDDPDTSYLGEYSNRPENEFAIDRAHAEDCASILPANPEGVQKLRNARAYIVDLQNAFASESQEWADLEDAYNLLDSLADDTPVCDCGEHGDMERGQYRYFNPCAENYAGLPDEDIRKYCRQDYERMESLNRGHWYYMGIYAEADVQTSVSAPIQTLRSGGLWGIESDSGQDYIESVEQDELAALKAELRAIGFSTRAISTAFKSIVRKDR